MFDFCAVCAITGSLTIAQFEALGPRSRLGHEAEKAWTPSGAPARSEWEPNEPGPRRRKGPGSFGDAPDPRRVSAGGMACAFLRFGFPRSREPRRCTPREQLVVPASLQ